MTVVASWWQYWPADDSSGQLMTVVAADDISSQVIPLATSFTDETIPVFDMSTSWWNQLPSTAIADVIDIIICISKRMKHAGKELPYHYRYAWIRLFFLPFTKSACTLAQVHRMLNTLLCTDILTVFTRPSRRSKLHFFSRSRSWRVVLYKLTSYIFNELLHRTVRRDGYQSIPIAQMLYITEVNYTSD